MITHSSGPLVTRMPAVASSKGSARPTEVDSFGVLKLNPTREQGREWSLPADAQNANGEWVPDGDVVPLGDGVFRQRGGQVRSSVRSPRGKTWWKNIEMTGYMRYRGSASGDDGMAPHWEWEVRGERHTNNRVNPREINGGVRAPAGTDTWPGYPYERQSSIPGSCLGTAYHGNIYADGRRQQVLIEKEISHTNGYAERRGSASVPGFDPRQWFGFKTIVRNSSDGTKVKIETWIDARADNTWTKVSEAIDAGGWAAEDSLDECGTSPFGYREDQLLSWAGPYATFRSDSADYDFKWYSVRELDPLETL
jgi:hypothetical protein